VAENQRLAICFFAIPATLRQLARIIRGKTAIEVQPFQNEGKTVVP